MTRILARANLPVVLVTLLALASCSAPPRDTLRVGIDVDAGTLDPRLARDTTAYRVVNLLYDGLVALDDSNESMTPVPALAQRWENPSPTEWIFYLRDDARFHDGETVTAEDVVYTFETLLDLDFGAPLRSLYAPIENVRAVDARTVVMTLGEPYAPLLRYLDLGIVPSHLAEDGHDLGAQPVGSGPYQLTAWNKGNKIVLESNPHYWAGHPSVSALEVVIIPDNTARAQAFEAGDLDLIQSPLSPQDVARLESMANVDARPRAGLAVTYFNFNTGRAILSDPPMRLALAMLVDQKTIVEEIYEGTDQPATSILLPSWDAFDDSIRQPSYDPDEADRLLAELGWRDTDDDGVLDLEGQKLSLELGTHSEDVNRIQTIEFLQNVFSRHGIETRLSISDWPSFSVRRDAGEYDIILLGWTQLVDPDRVLFDQLHSSGGLNWGRYHNPALDEALERGRASTEPSERKRVYREAARIISEEVPYYVLSYQAFQTFASARLQGFEPERRGMLRNLVGASFAPES